MIYNSYDNIGLVKVLSFLKSHNTEYLSGQDLSDVLKISRVAVWKHIKNIKKLGYKIESKQKLGYKLKESTNLLLPWEIKDGLQTKLLGQRAYFFEKIDSTQNYALKIASNKKEHGSIIIAQRQTNGRGRQGRKWISPKGGIWLSLILHPEFDASKSTLFPIAAAVALAEAVKKTFRKNAQLKWPNDVLLNNKKVAGIITDASFESNRMEFLILGAGINFNINTIAVEKKIKKTENYQGVASLTNDKLQNPKEFIQNFLVSLENKYELLVKNKIDSIINDWTKFSATVGKNVQFSLNGNKIKGRAIKIDRNGRLIVKVGKNYLKLVAEDIKQE